jgi:cbb3-type cytochrome oxidase maturation protein
MNVIILLLGFSLFIAIIFLIAFLWAVKSGQFDDKYTPSVRILFDDTNSEVDFKMKNKKERKKSDNNSKNKEDRINPEDKSKEIKIFLN